ncbi:copper-resistance protein, CopA family [Pseudoxanthomonas sp. GM95]|uniref:copper resistance system multicopper oxidase n=1 Tax=Pseudoxanthomonas sp. GM95 TaxID=1881043 RepID=UPI0008B3790C|nr:copper resistance system multicopper oxidase [Pseudoxanthomonas sp. GM95]SEL10588.1 copper-resistance protein, CopA family [Pseudoxanthomonas sp. GM95]
MSMEAFRPPGFSTTRRRFVTGTGLALAGSSLAVPGLALGQSGSFAPQVPELRGQAFDLSIGALPVNITGRPSQAVAINGSMPGPTLHWREGDEVTLKVSNRLGVDTSLHWHGIILPAAMDGVPGLSFHGIGPSESYLYRFKLKQSGTYWYHAHSSLQEAKGAFGAIVVAPAGPDPVAVDRDYVLLLSDWSDEDPHAIVRKLKLQPDYYNVHKRTVGDFVRDARQQGLKVATQDRRMWGQMRMSPTDLADVSGQTYTYLVNGASPDANWSGLFKRGERVRLRFINGSAMSFFDVRIPGLKMTVVAADGQPVHPVSVDEFRIAVAETLDVVVQPQEDQPYTVFCQAMDRSGYARATLTPRPGLQAPVPPLDPRPLLTMADMGMDHGHGGMSHGAMAMPGTSTSNQDHAGMDHASMGHGDMGAMEASAMAGMGHDHAMPGMGTTKSAIEVRHPASESNNPAVDMQTMTPSRALDDPGIGLRDNGRRVLTAADLHSTFDDPDPREPGRELQLHLTGNMERYVWGFDGIPFSKAGPVKLNYGERVRIVLVNDTMMEHPIHLHGMWSDVESADGQFQVRRHTVSVPPGSVRSYRVSADALGRWAFHCHMLLHMELGMFREVQVA